MAAHKSRLGTMIIDCKDGDLASHAEFWSAALGLKSLPADPDYPNYRVLETAENDVPVLLQSVEHASRIHIDIETDDKEAECARLEACGAKIVTRVDEPGKNWIIMEAPSGHRFCLVKPQRHDFAENANQWGEE